MAAATVAMGRIERAHQMYRDGQHREALKFYTEALSMAKTKSQRIALHSNRAACYLKLHDFEKISHQSNAQRSQTCFMFPLLGVNVIFATKAAEECSSVLELDNQHAGALMLRAQTLVTLKEYQSALFDVNRLIDFNPSSEVYRNLQARLRTQLSLAPIPESMEELEEEDEVEDEGENGGQAKAENDNKTSGQEIATRDACEENESPVDKTDEKVLQLFGCEDDGARNLDAPKEKPNAALLKRHNAKEDVGKKIEFDKISFPVLQTQKTENSATMHPKGWDTIPKPKGHLGLDYSRWDQVEDDSSEDEEEDQQPQYRFRVKTVGVRPVK